jgi:hypothetical protein
MFILNDVNLSNYGRGRDRVKRKSRGNLLRNAAIGVGGLAVAGGLGYLALRGKGKAVTKTPVTTVSKPKYKTNYFGLNEDNPITLPDNISARQLELAKRGNLKALGIKGKEANTQSVTNRLNYLFYGENKGRGKLKFNNINEVKNLIRKRRKDIIGNQKESYLKYVKDVKKHNNLFSSDSIMRQKINSYNQYKKQNLSIEQSMQNKNMKDQRDKITDVTQKVPGEKYYYYSRNNNNVINLIT